jgi:hypothetical protein
MHMHSSLFSFIFLTKKKEIIYDPDISIVFSLSLLLNDVVMCIYT